METPRHWRLKAQGYRLDGSTCPTCGQLSFPPRPVCLDCTDQPRRIAGGGISVLPALNRTVDTNSLKG
jgi:hypothetical protein